MFPVFLEVVMPAQTCANAGFQISSTSGAVAGRETAGNQAGTMGQRQQSLQPTEKYMGSEGNWQKEWVQY